VYHMRERPVTLLLCGHTRRESNVPLVSFGLEQQAYSRGLGQWGSCSAVSLSGVGLFEGVQSLILRASPVSHVAGRGRSEVWNT
jgi:hypothetical protein